jgi:Rps23 Pro-64 3,4-dihydroxylase Tpa1-like proline 4-hydroxylase
MNSGITAWKNFLNQEEISLIDNECDKYGWKPWENYYMTPNPGTNVRVFWAKDMMKSDKVKNLLIDKIENFLGKKIIVDRLFANARSHGQCGNFHTDVPLNQEGECLTFVYYIHKGWRPEYGGHLIFEINKEIISYWPESNSAILFNSKMQHCVLEPTIHCKEFRMNLSMMFRVKDKL